MKSHGIVLALLSLTAIVASAPVQAQNGPFTRTFVSSAGNDGNPCTITQPCATFAHAYTQVSANGIIAALDPGKYGPLNITGPVTVNGNGWAAVTAPSGQVGITISGGANDKVTLDGINIDGAGAGDVGIAFFSPGGSLVINNCVIQNFVTHNQGGSGSGIIIEPGFSSGTFSFFISNTTSSNNANSGIYYFPQVFTGTANGVMDHVVTNANQVGFQLNTVGTSNNSFSGGISNSIVTNNTQDGIDLQAPSGNPFRLSIDNVSVIGNANNGIDADLNVNVMLGRSVVSGNGTGISNGTNPTNTFYSFGNNQIGLNTTDVNTAFGHNQMNTSTLQLK